ncbi:stage VI sporulation protein F [Cohnella sp. REN36]|uniref:stage VI sporulation protein F n=1 Tax=Cohnella sp. REN36 TaxID=2887347 RepID=UPI001D13FE30|nr:stage VI sporulation protein F [Cohnella sp. REN36]MCC3373499.1 stage VI sporulation protein F [Cohnella sp. REN36]
MDKKLSKDILNTVTKKTGKTVSESSLKKIASKVSPETLQSETQIRQLIKQVSATAGVPVTEETVKEIVSAIKRSGMNMNSLEGLMKMMMKK